jgi:hypothetical protein
MSGAMIGSIKRGGARTKEKRKRKKRRKRKKKQKAKESNHATQTKWDFCFLFCLSIIRTAPHTDAFRTGEKQSIALINSPKCNFSINFMGCCRSSPHKFPSVSLRLANVQIGKRLGIELD